MTRPLLLLTTGLVASGKSTVAAGVAAALDLQILRSDVIRKELVGLPPEASGRDAYGAGLYSAARTHQTYAALADRARSALRQGQAVLLDAAFSKRAERLQMGTLAQEVGADCCLLECLAPAEVLRARLRQRDQASTSISDAREDILAPFQRDYEPVQPDEGMCHIRLETTQPVEQCVLQALAALDVQRP